METRIFHGTRIPSRRRFAFPQVCRHCSRGKVNRPRGLCWHCYYTPGVKALYPSTSKFARRGVGNGLYGVPLPEPTNAAPGTPDKLAVMEARAESGRAIFHPEDAGYANGGA